MLQSSNSRRIAQTRTSIKPLLVDDDDDGQFFETEELSQLPNRPSALLIFLFFYNNALDHNR